MRVAWRACAGLASMLWRTTNSIATIPTIPTGSTPRAIPCSVTSLSSSVRSDRFSPALLVERPRAAGVLQHGRALGGCPIARILLRGGLNAVHPLQEICRCIAGASDLTCDLNVDGACRGVRIDVEDLGLWP